MESPYSKEHGSQNCLLKIDVKSHEGKKYELVIMQDGEEIIFLIHNEEVLRALGRIPDDELISRDPDITKILNEEVIGFTINHSQALRISTVLTGHIEEFMFDDMVEYVKPRTE